MLAIPLAATASDLIFQRLAQAASRDGGFEDCATACQQQIDASISRCSGYREVLDPSDTSPPPPKCKALAIEQFEICKARCPAPHIAGQG